MEDFYRVSFQGKCGLKIRPQHEIETLVYVLIACCGGTTGDSGATVRIPGEGRSKDRIGVRLGSCELEGGGEEEEGWED